MSTPDANTNPPHNPFGLLKAILIGTALGFFAVLAVPYVLPPHHEPVTYATAGLQPEAVKAPSVINHPPRRRVPGGVIKTAEGGSGTPQEAGHGADAGPPPPEAKDKSGDGSGQPPVPPAPQPKDTEKTEPVLVPAVNLKYPKLFSDEDMNAALEPLLSFKISDDDAAAIKEVISSVSRGDDASARTAIKKISDPAAKTFAEWKRLRPSTADFNEVMAFRKAHPLFPEPVQEPGIEKSLFFSGASGADILKFYTNRNPTTGAGKASLGAALMETGERERGLRLIKFVWSRYTLDPAVQERFLARFGELLDENDQNRRKLLIEARVRQQDDPGKRLASASEGRGLKGAARLRAKRAGRQSAHGGRHGRKSKIARRSRGRRHGEIQDSLIQREAELSGKARAFNIESLSTPVRLKKRRHKHEDTPKDGADGKADKPEKVSDNPGDTGGKTDTKPWDAKDEKPKKDLQLRAAENAFRLAKESTGGSATLLARLKSLRREGADDDVWSLLRSLNPDTADLADPERWWDFRRNEVRRALSEDHPATAYAIAKNHGPLDDEGRSEAEFLAGWIALRFLKEPRLAEPHFEAAHAIKGYARDEARAAYWLGRTKLELGARKEAEVYFREAASRFYTFYGSLARQALHKAGACEFRAPPQPTKEATTAFVNEDAFKAVMIAKQLDLQPLLTNYLLDLARQLNDPEQMTLALELTERVAPSHVMVRAAKIALLRGFPVDAYAFPTLLPKFEPAGGNTKLELALLNALTRQESDFHTGSVSRVGARGLMQLMPQTAKLVAASYKLRYDASRLTSDPSYNVTLGSAFLAQLLSGYDGSYVLSLAAYNAGPGRAKEWIKDFGDPRNKSSDPIDWVERIPFTETRQYIQRILESTQLYRCRFENGKTKFQIVEDLHRGRPGKIPDIEDVSGSGELEQAQ
jgi:soluble lytic murein transglycosylase